MSKNKKNDWWENNFIIDGMDRKTAKKIKDRLKKDLERGPNGPNSNISKGVNND